MAHMRDEHLYETEADAPDLGSFKRGADGSYYGLKKDIDKLPSYDDMQQGTSAICVDTGDVLFYLETTKTWYLPGTEVIS